jgi:hypothetical protein
MEPALDIQIVHKFAVTITRQEVIPSVPFGLRIVGPRSFFEDGAYVGFRWRLNETEKKSFRHQGILANGIDFQPLGKSLSIIDIPDVYISYKFEGVHVVHIDAIIRSSSRVIICKLTTSCKAGDLESLVCFCCQSPHSKNLCLYRPTAGKDSFAYNQARNPLFATCAACMKRWKQGSNRNIQRTEAEEKMMDRYNLTFDTVVTPELYQQEEEKVDCVKDKYVSTLKDPYDEFLKVHQSILEMDDEYYFKDFDTLGTCCDLFCQ